MDTIFIKEFKVATLIGVYEWERQVPQTIQLDLEIGLTDCHAMQSDRVEDTVDYGAVVIRIQDTLKQQHFFLLEKLAEHIAQLILQEFSATRVKVSVAKLNLISGVKKLGVTIERCA